MVGGALAAVACMSAMAGATLPADLTSQPIERHDSGLAPDWPRHSVFMEILVRAYQDSDGDGIGDLPGLTRRLDYLKSLGIGALWLSPIYPSADHDHGYAVSDYRNVAPEFGTLADFDTLIAEAHRRGMAVILDYVMNHSADTHPLFAHARDHADSPWRDWFIWSKDKPSGWTTYGGDPWHPSISGYYYGAFSANMPDWNLRHPAVLAFHLDNLKFWLNRGVDGFRFDAVGALVENGPLAWENQPENHQIMAQVRGLLDQYGKRFMVAEAPGAPAEFAAADSAGSAFAFGLQTQIIKSVQLGRVQAGLIDYLKQNPLARMGTFLSNHDSFAGARVFQQLDGDPAGYKLAAATLLTLPGIPFVYYGEEVGQSFSEPVQEEDQRLRGPMSWDADGRGFSAGRPFRPLADNRAHYNVDAESVRADSLLNTYRMLIHLRQRQPALAVGDFELLSRDDDDALVFARSQADSRLLVALNYAPHPVAIALPAGSWQVLAASGAEQGLHDGEIRLPGQQWLILQRTAVR